MPRNVKLRKVLRMLSYCGGSLSFDRSNRKRLKISMRLEGEGSVPSCSAMAIIDAHQVDMDDSNLLVENTVIGLAEEVEEESSQLYKRSEP